MRYYTLGFIFDPDLQHVLLIQKNRPAWQIGLLNGLGGKLKKDETFSECISREVNEEAGILIDVSQWTSLGKMQGEDWEVHVFTAIYQQEKENAKSVTDEQVGWYKVDQLPANIISNLSWLIPSARDKLKNI